MTIGALAFIAATAAGAALGMQSTGSVAAGDKAAIEKIVRDYILEHPEIIPEAVERLQAKRVADSIGESRKAIETPYAGAWEGAANGDVILVEFFDYACGYCRASLADLAKLVGEDKGLFGTRAEARLWVTDDARRIPVQIRSRQPWGTITLRLDRMTTGSPVTRPGDG